jgi:dTDP-4-dehydrorhamnose reductase
VRGERVLVTGGSGQLGSDLELLLSDTCTVAAPPHGELDICDGAAVAEAFDALGPTAVINCAAFHNVEVCEREAYRSFQVNATAVKRLAERCAKAGARFVHLSTNYVFDGTRPDPYHEDDLPAPRSIYAISKLAGEHAALAYAPHTLVVRTAGLYGLQGSASKGGNFVTRMLKRATDGEPITMVADQRLSPTFTSDLARAVVEALDGGVHGVMHLTNSGECSWFDFTRAIAEIAGVDAQIEPAPTVRRPGAADRPLNGVLARPAADAAGLTPLPHWREALAGYMERAGLAAARAA